MKAKISELKVEFDNLRRAFRLPIATPRPQMRYKHVAEMGKITLMEPNMMGNVGVSLTTMAIEPRIGPESIHSGWTLRGFCSSAFRAITHRIPRIGVPSIRWG